MPQETGGFTRVGLGGGGLTRGIRDKLAIEEDQDEKVVLSLSRDGGHVTLCLSSAERKKSTRAAQPGAFGPESGGCGVIYVAFRCSDEARQLLVGRRGCERRGDGAVVLRCPGETGACVSGFGVWAVRCAQLPTLVQGLVHHQWCIYPAAEAAKRLIRAVLPEGYRLLVGTCSRGFSLTRL